MAEVTAAPVTTAAPVNTGTAAAPATGSAAPAAVVEPPRKIKLKLDGKDVEMLESEVVAYAQQGKVATQRFQEAAKMRAEAEEVLKFAKANPTEFFNKTGLNARQWAEEYLMKELQAEAMSPEQRKASENEEKLRKYEMTEKQRADAALEAQKERAKQEHMLNYDQMFVKALNESGLPKNQFTIKRMAELQLINIKNKYDLSATQLAKLVREDFAAEQKSIMGGLDGDQLLDFLGADLVKKLSKAQIAKLKAKAQPGAKSAQTNSLPTEGKELDWIAYQRRNRGR